LSNTAFTDLVNVASNSVVIATVLIESFKTVSSGSSVGIDRSSTINNVWINNNGISSEVENGTITVGTVTTSRNCIYSSGTNANSVINETLIIVESTNWNGS